MLKHKERPATAAHRWHAGSLTQPCAGVPAPAELCCPAADSQAGSGSGRAGAPSPLTDGGVLPERAARPAQSPTSARGDTRAASAKLGSLVLQPAKH